MNIYFKISSLHGLTIDKYCHEKACVPSDCDSCYLRKKWLKCINIQSNLLSMHSEYA